MLQSLVKLAAAAPQVAAGGVVRSKAKVDVLLEFEAPIVEVRTQALRLTVKPANRNNPRGWSR